LQALKANKENYHMAETTEQKDATTQPGESKPTVTTAATFGDAQSTDPQTGQSYNPLSEIQVDRAGTKKTVDELIKGYHFGELYKKKQSDFDKTQVENQKLQQRLDELESWKAKQEQNRMIDERIKRIAPKKSEPEDEFGSTEDGSTAIDQNEFVQQFNEAVRLAVDQQLGQYGIKRSEVIPTKQEISNEMLEIMQQREARLAEDRERQDFIKSATESYKTKLNSEYNGVLSDTELDEVVKLRELAILKQRIAEATIVDPDPAIRRQAMDEWLDSRDSFDKAVGKLAAAQVRATEKARQAEVDNQLLSGQYPGYETLKTVSVEPTFDKNEQIRRRKVIVEESAKRADMLAAAKRVRGVGR